MEFGNFIKILKRHKFTIIIIPIITIIITYFLVRNQPDVYSSQAKIATGIVDQTQKVLSDGADAQESKISQEFSNLIEMLRSKKMLDQLAYKLIIHDLTSPTPYRKPSTLFTQLNTSARQHAVDRFADLYRKRESLSLFNVDDNGLNKLLMSMRYDDQSILKTMTIYRVQTSDYISVDFESESSELSAVTVNTLCSEFINYYTFLVKENQRKAVDFLGSLLHAKQDTLNSRMEALKDYKIKNHVLNLNEKASSIYSQMSESENRREELDKNVQATQAAINRIDQQFDPNNPQYREASQISINQSILASREQLQQLNDQYAQSNFDQKYTPQIDSLRNVIASQVLQASDKYILNPLSTKQNLVDQKMQLQVQHNLARNSEPANNRELARLNASFNSLVPHEAEIQALESAISVASQEYLEILAKYNQTNMVSNFSITLRIIETAEPGLPAPSKKMLLVILSGIITFIFCLVVLFFLFFFDNTVKNPRELANKTKSPVLGQLNLLSSTKIDLREVWSDTTTSGELRQFRNLMQSIRFEVDQELAGNKILLVNSLSRAEGKTFLSINLAYAYSLINKKVLLIDGNFNNTGITQATNPKVYLEDFLNDRADESFLQTTAKTTVIGNRGGDISLLEVSSEEHIKQKLDQLRNAFDVIIIEASPLETLNKSKEWNVFADKVLTVFEAGKVINENDKHYIDTLKHADNKFIGWILNLVHNEHLVTEV